MCCRLRFGKWHFVSKMNKNMVERCSDATKHYQDSGADPGFFLGEGALISCSTSTPINHIVFFLQNTSCIRKPQVISGGGVRTPCTLPLDPRLRLALSYTCVIIGFVSSARQQCFSFQFLYFNVINVDEFVGLCVVT